MKNAPPSRSGKPGTMQRRAYAMALYTGQRKQDQIMRTRKHRQDGGIVVVQSKTGEELWIPEHRELTKELALGVATMDTLLVTPTQGKPFDGVYYGAWFADAIEEAGLPDDACSGCGNAPHASWPSSG